VDHYGLIKAGQSGCYNANGDNSMVLIESSEILDTLKLLHSFTATFSLQEASKAYQNIICLIQLMEKESTEEYKYAHRDMFTEGLPDIISIFSSKTT
jgi:predicted ABC-type exoprotein transport system permease subunit